jgi:hypothetical protein
MRTIDKIITNVSTKYGAPMGRNNIGTKPTVTTSGKNCKIVKRNQITVFDCRVPMCDNAYDKGGVYWGISNELRVSYTKDLSYVEFYRKGVNENPRK